MDKQELLYKLAQIEDNARDALDEFPQLTRERLRMISALARYLRGEASQWPDSVSEAGLRASAEDDVKATGG